MRVDTNDVAALVEANMGLVYAAAKRFYWADKSEVVQSGCVGLAEAAARFDNSKGAFSSFAVPYILGEIKAFLRRDHSVHIPRATQDLASKAAYASKALAQTLGREPTIGEIAAELCVAADELAYALESRRPVTSVDDKAEESDRSFEVADDRQQATFEMVHTRDMLDRLGEVERAIIQMRYFRGFTQTQVAKALDISQSKVCRIEKDVLGRLREG